MPQKAPLGSHGNAVTREKTEELDGAGGVFARGPVATVNARPGGRLLKVLVTAKH